MTTRTLHFTAERFHRQDNLAVRSVSRFLVVMASISVASKVVELLVSKALSAWFGVALDPFCLSVARQAVVTLLGIGVAYYISRHGQASAAKRQMFLTPLVTMGVGLVLVLLGQVVGQTDAFDWPVALVYLLWAWGSAASAV